MSYDVDDKMLERFAERAKRLMYGMRRRFHQDPDVADFFLAFRDELGVGDPLDPEDARRWGRINESAYVLAGAMGMARTGYRGNAQVPLR